MQRGGRMVMVVPCAAGAAWWGAGAGALAEGAQQVRVCLQAPLDFCGQRCLAVAHRLVAADVGQAEGEHGGADVLVLELDRRRRADRVEPGEQGAAVCGLRVRFPGEFGLQHGEVIIDCRGDLGGGPVPATRFGVITDAGLPGVAEESRDLRFHRIRAGVTVGAPPVKRHPPAGPGGRLGGRAHAGRHRPPSCRTGSVWAPRGELFGDPVGGQALAWVVHQQVEDEPGVLRQRGVERLRQRAVGVAPFDTAVPFTARVLFPQRIIVIKRHHGQPSRDNQIHYAWVGT